MTSPPPAEPAPTQPPTLPPAAPSLAHDLLVDTTNALTGMVTKAAVWRETGAADPAALAREQPLQADVAALVRTLLVVVLTALTARETALAEQANPDAWGRVRDAHISTALDFQDAASTLQQGAA